MINNHGMMMCMRKLKSRKKGSVGCMGTISTSSLKFAPSSSKSQQNEKIERLKTEVQDLKEVLGNVLTLLQTKFPDDNVNVVTVMRAFNREVFDASSGLNLSQRPRN